MAHHFNFRSMAWGSHNNKTPERKKTTPEENDNPKFSIMRPLEKGIATIAGGYYSATYIPDEDDPLGVAVTETVRHGPFFLLFRDVWICATMFTLFPGVITPFWSTNPQDEFYMGSWTNVLGISLLGFASVFSVALVIVCIPLFLFLPGPVSVAIFVSGQVLLHFICYPLQGPSRVWSKDPTDPVEVEKHDRNKDERWFFLNGCCVSGYNLQQNVDLLSETFGRPIFAIHNRTYGVLGDLFECIIQRSFDLYTEETRVAYEYVKAYCTDPEVRKVVIIAHSQGTIMASQILDQLYVDLPAEAVSKIEVYTFGNAASRFNNPLRALAKQDTIDARDTMDGLVSGARPLQPRKKPQVKSMLPERVIPHIEHYCNSEDMVTRWGALFSAKQILQSRFCGHIFINNGQSGHMLNQHYLSKMFPIPSKSVAGRHTRNDSGVGQGDLVNGVVESSATTLNGDAHEDDGDEANHVPFLDRVVKLDTATITQRHQQARHQLAIMRHESALNDTSNHSHAARTTDISDLHQTAVRPASKPKQATLEEATDDELDLKLGEGKKLTSKDLSGAEGSRISVVHRHGWDDYPRGRTVRQLSRLWRYMDGADPDGRHWVESN